MQALRFFTANVGTLVGKKDDEKRFKEIMNLEDLKQQLTTYWFAKRNK